MSISDEEELGWCSCCGCPLFDKEEVDNGRCTVCQSSGGMDQPH